MGKVKALFVCSTCERPSAQWSGRCAACGEWGTIGEHPAGSALRVGGRASAPPVLSLVPEAEERRIGTGFPSIDRVLGGGFVPGSVVLLAGAPGIGKSTLLLQLGSRLAGAGHPCLLASGEEARSQVAARAGRLGLDGNALQFIAGRELSTVVSGALQHRPHVLVVDSIHTLRDETSEALPGGVGQVRSCADALVALAKEHHITVVLIGHVTKGGDLAGPRTLEHVVDVVLTFEGDPRSGRRIVAGGKNRFGPDGEVAWFEMTSTGLEEVEPGPRLGDGRAEAGSATALATAGRRSFAVEIQALVVPSGGPPRRQVAGMDPRRFQIVAAVTDSACRLGVGKSEIYAACSGGFHLDDPGSDLAMAAALVSAAKGAPLPSGVALIGEISLTGTVRPVGEMEQRLSAAAGAGVQTVLVSEMGGTGLRMGSVELVRVTHVRDVVEWAYPAAGAGRAFRRRPYGP
jgi:DNA repair protein RadA/Sms